MTDSDEGAPDLEPLLRFVRDSRGFDFTGYKRAGLTRRIHKRMQTVGVDDYPAYQQVLEAQPQEFAELFNTILINVTGFLRDRDAWEYLEADVIPRILDGKGDDGSIRVWSAGCASGEETYSVAVLLCGALGEDSFRQRVKIYGTDADEDALVEARHARYPIGRLEEAFDADQLGRFFEADDDSMVFRKDLRRSVIFGRHDLVQDAPISRVDLLVCRNTLMYFTADIQRRVLDNFHFALNPGGFLFLGKSEALVSHANVFAIDDPKRHVFVKDGSLLPTRPPLAWSGAPSRQAEISREPLVDAAFEASPVAQVVLDRNRDLVAVNRHARSLFGLGLLQVGRPFKDLELSYRPAELRSRVEQLFVDRRPVTISEVEIGQPGGTVEHLDIHLFPLGGEADLAGVCLTFTEVGRSKALREELERSRRELETAYEELQSTVEELETTNEELQSTNEELETTNEELHSTNEELETMNEELQSTNEELETINDELRDRGIELDEVNAFLESIVGSIGFATVVLNEQISVRVWSRQAQDLWGLRSDEVEGTHFLDLDIGLPVEELRQPIRACLLGQSDHEVRVLDAVNRRGRPLRCEVNVSPLLGADGRPTGVILRMAPGDGGDGQLQAPAAET